MIRPTLLPLALLTATSAAAQGDPRLVSHLYDDDEVVSIEGHLGVQASIAFDEDEHIENVAIGDSANWQVTPNKRANLLFVKPLTAHARTNLTVVTDRHTYFFDLVASPSAKPIYVLRFTYPEEPDKQPVRQAGLTEDEQTALEGQPPKDPAVLNFAWRSKGASQLFPSRIYDDGDATYLTWSEKQAIPAILVRDPKGEEGPVNYSVRGDVIVIGEVPSEIILRSGGVSATLENLSESASAGEAGKPSRLAVAQDTKE